MYFAGLVAIGWLYVTVLMAATQPSVLAGLATFVFYGLMPVAIVVYVMLAPERRRRRRAAEEAERQALKTRTPQDSSGEDGTSPK